MRNGVAAAALAIGLGLASGAHAQTPDQDKATPLGFAPAAEPESGGGTPAAETAGPVETVSAEPIAVEAVEGEPQGHAPGDPLEGWNRGVYNFNDALDRVLVEPVAKGYRAVTPGFFRSGVRNFLHNLLSPVILANDVLQVEPKRAGDTIGRFALNSTIGVLGLFDVAKHAGLPSHDEDFGQTLGKWGVGSGPYLMLPVLGPSNLRDVSGKVVDFAIDPINHAEFKDDDLWRAGRTGADLLTQRTDAIEAVDSVRETSLDPYSSVRSAYDQARATAILNGQEAAPDSPESEDNLSQ